MSEQSEEKSLLAKAIASVQMDRLFHVSIHDTSGILHNNPELSLPIEMTVHHEPFCRFIKTFPYYSRMCLRCKAASLKKALETKKQYFGQCHAGITEIVRPVFLEDKLVCVIFLGNIEVLGKKDKRLQKLRKISSLTGASLNDLKALTQNLDTVSEPMLKRYDDMLDVLEYLILSLASQRPFVKNLPTSFPVYSSTNHWAIQAIQKYVQEYYSRDLHLSQLAGLYFLNPDYLCRLFHKETGTSFSEYVNNMRLEKAKHLLEMTPDDIMSIATQVGFANVTYFNRLFKRQTGMTPKEYRRAKYK